MSEGYEARASHEEVEGFVTKIGEFQRFLNESEQAMLATILEGSQTGDTGGYGIRVHRYGTTVEGSSSESQVEG